MRNHLRHKGVNVTILCPFCMTDVEHLLHVFFDCEFATQCWQYLGHRLDMRAVEYAPSWLLQILSSGSSEEIISIVTGLWGIWNARNMRLWENKVLTSALAMEWSRKTVNDWREVKNRSRVLQKSSHSVEQTITNTWVAPQDGEFKLKTEASVLGMVGRNI